MTDTTMTNDELFDQYCNACAWGQLSRAHAAIDELCRPERASQMTDMLPLPRACAAFAAYSDLQLQGTTDRVEQYNSFVRR